MLHLRSTSILPPLCYLVLVTLPIIFYFHAKKYRASSKALLITTMLLIIPIGNCYYPIPTVNRAAAPFTKSISVPLSLNYIRQYSCTWEKRNNNSLNDKSIGESILPPQSPYTTTKRKEKHCKEQESRTTRFRRAPFLAELWTKLATNLLVTEKQKTKVLWDYAHLLFDSKNKRQCSHAKVWLSYENKSVVFIRQYCWNIRTRGLGDDTRRCFITKNKRLWGDYTLIASLS